MRFRVAVLSFVVVVAVAALVVVVWPDDVGRTDRIVKVHGEVLGL